MGSNIEGYLQRLYYIAHIIKLVFIHCWNPVCKKANEISKIITRMKLISFFFFLIKQKLYIWGKNKSRQPCDAVFYDCMHRHIHTFEWNGGSIAKHNVTTESKNSWISQLQHCRWWKKYQSQQFVFNDYFPF